MKNINQVKLENKIFKELITEEKELLGKLNILYIV